MNEKEMSDLIDKWFDETIRIPTGDIRCSGDFSWDELVSLGIWLEKHFKEG